MTQVFIDEDVRIDNGLPLGLIWVGSLTEHVPDESDMRDAKREERRIRNWNPVQFVKAWR